MKQFRSTIIVFIIFIGFVSYYFIVEKKKTIIEEKEIIYIFNFNKDDLKTLELIDLSDGSRILLTKDKKWKIEKPFKMPASKNTVDGMISALAVLSADRDITEGGERLKKYGLDVPKYRVKFSTGNKSHTLSIGVMNPAEDLYFVKVEGKDNIYTANVSSVDKFIRKKLTDIRDKEFLSIPEKEIKNIALDIKNKEKIIIERNNEKKWIIKTAGEKDLSNDIQNIIDDLSKISIEEFIQEGSSDLMDYGLKKPSYSVSINKKRGGQVDLFFGKIENNLVYTSKNKENNLYKVRRNIIDSIENLYINMKE